jgi:hypothetical protein
VRVLLLLVPADIFSSACAVAPCKMICALC